MKTKTIKILIIFLLISIILNGALFAENVPQSQVIIGGEEQGGQQGGEQGGQQGGFTVEEYIEIPEVASNKVSYRLLVMDNNVNIVNDGKINVENCNENVQIKRIFEYYATRDLDFEQVIYSNGMMNGGSNGSHINYLNDFRKALMPWYTKKNEGFIRNIDFVHDYDYRHNEYGKDPETGYYYIGMELMYPEGYNVKYTALYMKFVWDRYEARWEIMDIATRDIGGYYGYVNGYYSRNESLTSTAVDNLEQFINGDQQEGGTTPGGQGGTTPGGQGGTTPGGQGGTTPGGQGGTTPGGQGGTPPGGQQGGQPGGQGGTTPGGQGGTTPEGQGGTPPGGQPGMQLPEENQWPNIFNGEYVNVAEKETVKINVNTGNGNAINDLETQKNNYDICVIEDSDSYQLVENVINNFYEYVMNDYNYELGVEVNKGLEELEKAQQNQQIIDIILFINNNKEGNVPPNQMLTDNQEGNVPPNQMPTDNQEGNVPPNQMPTDNQEGNVPPNQMPTDNQEGNTSTNQPTYVVFPSEEESVIIVPMSSIYNKTVGSGLSTVTVGSNLENEQSINANYQTTLNFQSVGNNAESSYGENTEFEAIVITESDFATLTASDIVKKFMDFNGTDIKYSQYSYYIENNVLQKNEDKGLVSVQDGGNIIYDGQFIDKGESWEISIQDISQITSEKIYIIFKVASNYYAMELINQNGNWKQSEFIYGVKQSNGSFTLGDTIVQMDTEDLTENFSFTVDLNNYETFKDAETIKYATYAYSRDENNLLIPIQTEDKKTISELLETNSDNGYYMDNLGWFTQKNKNTQFKVYNITGQHEKVYFLFKNEKENSSEFIGLEFSKNEDGSWNTSLVNEYTVVWNEEEGYFQLVENQEELSFKIETQTDIRYAIRAFEKVGNNILMAYNEYVSFLQSDNSQSSEDDNGDEIADGWRSITAGTSSIEIHADKLEEIGEKTSVYMLLGIKGDEDGYIAVEFTKEDEKWSYNKIYAIRWENNMWQIDEGTTNKVSLKTEFDNNTKTIKIGKIENPENNIINFQYRLMGATDDGAIEDPLFTAEGGSLSYIKNNGVYNIQITPTSTSETVKLIINQGQDDERTIEWQYKENEWKEVDDWN